MNKFARLISGVDYKIEGVLFLRQQVPIITTFKVLQYRLRVNVLQAY